MGFLMKKKLPFGVEMRFALPIPFDIAFIAYIRLFNLGRFKALLRK